MEVVVLLVCGSNHLLIYYRFYITCYLCYDTTKNLPPCIFLPRPQSL